MSRLTLRQWLGAALTVIAALLVLLAFRQEPAPEPERPKPSVVDEAETTAVPIPEGVDARFVGLVRHMWWHQDLAGPLELTEDQVTQMDALCLGFLRRRWTLRRQLQDDPDTFFRLLRDDSLEAAARSLDLRERAAAERVVLYERMVLDVLRTLDPEQLETARREVPDLFSQPWLKGVSGNPRSNRPPQAPPRPVEALPRQEPGG